MDGPRVDRPKRRQFTTGYKLAMVAARDAATELGAKGALLRREGLYHSPVHADRGTSMTSKPVALLLPDLGIDRGRVPGQLCRRGSDQASPSRTRPA